MKIDLLSYLTQELFSVSNALPLHPTFVPVFKKLKKWVNRFYKTVDETIAGNIVLFYLLAPRQFLDHRNSGHLFRLFLSIHSMEKRLLQTSTFSHHLRHLEIRWMPASLHFPFSSKPVLGCLIGFNVMDRYDLFDEENIVLALQKHIPELKLVEESTYPFTSSHKHLKVLYFEIEKKNGKPLSLKERTIIKNSLNEKVRNSIQKLAPSVYMGHNEEEVFKNILVMNQEIQSFQDLPQAYIALDQQTGNEVVFRVILVYISSIQPFSLKERFFNSLFISHHVVNVRRIGENPIEAQVFCIHFPRDSSVLRSNGSLDFYAARYKITNLIRSAIGNFRDFNGGILVQQQGLLDAFKNEFHHIAIHDPEFLEVFFHALTPIEKQVILPLSCLSNLFSCFLEKRNEKLAKDATYSLKIIPKDFQKYIVVHSDNCSLKSIALSVIRDPFFRSVDITYTFIDTFEGVFFNCMINPTPGNDPELFIHALKHALETWDKKLKNQQILRIALQHSLISLDPRIGGENSSQEVLRLLFEGLTRFNRRGQIENAVADSIDISADGRCYTFKLRRCVWNDESLVTAYDFEYAWKKMLSPDFKTAFAYYFYPLKNAKEAKEGKVSPDEIGIRVIDERTLQVELVNPIPYFLQLIADPLFSPIHHLIDQKNPQWLYQSGKNYPCNGPFQLKVNKPNQGFHLIKNPLYWNEKEIGLDQIVLTLMTQSEAVQKFQKQELDWIGNPFGGWSHLYTPARESRVVSFSNHLACWFVFNTQSFPFQNLKLRQAFAYAVERTSIIEEAFLPLNPAYSTLMPQHQLSQKFIFPEVNKVQARQLFQEALDELKLRREDLPSFTIDSFENGIQKYTSTWLYKQFKECFGIECLLKFHPWDTQFDKLTTGNFKLGLMQWNSRIDDPIYTLKAFKTTHQELNFSKWEHPEFEHFLNLGEKEQNLESRSSYLQKAEEILNQQMPVIPLFYQPYRAMVKKNLHITYNTACGSFDFARGFYKKKSF